LILIASYLVERKKLKNSKSISEKNLCNISQDVEKKDKKQKLP